MARASRRSLALSKSNLNSVQLGLFGSLIGTLLSEPRDSSLVASGYISGSRVDFRLDTVYTYGTRLMKT